MLKFIRDNALALFVSIGVAVGTYGFTLMAHPTEYQLTDHDALVRTALLAHPVANYDLRSQVQANEFREIQSHNEEMLHDIKVQAILQKMGLEDQQLFDSEREDLNTRRAVIQERDLSEQAARQQSAMAQMRDEMESQQRVQKEMRDRIDSQASELRLHWDLLQ